MPGTEEMVERVTRILAQLGEVPGDLAAQVVEEYYGMKLTSHYAREGGMEYLKPALWKQLSGLLIMAGGLACSFVWAARNARPAANEMFEIVGPNTGSSCKDLSKVDVDG